MRCKNYYKLSCLQPEHCYNCAMRSGYPWDLRGDKKCENYVSVKDSKRLGVFESKFVWKNGEFTMSKSGVQIPWDEKESAQQYLDQVIKNFKPESRFTGEMKPDGLSPVTKKEKELVERVTKKKPE